MTGAPLSPYAVDWASLGVVHHLCGRRVRPEWRNDPTHQILISQELHELTHGVWGGKLLLMLDPDDPTQPAVDALRPILFIRRERSGQELWRHIR